MTTFRVHRLILTMAALATCTIPFACASKSTSARRQSNQGGFDLSKDPGEFREQLLALIPIGSELDVAKQILESRGFSCNDSRSESASDVQKLTGRLDKPYTFLVTNTWSVIIEAKERRVTNVDARCWATGP